MSPTRFFQYILLTVSLLAVGHTQIFAQQQLNLSNTIEFNHHGRSLRFPIPDGHCVLDLSQAYDRALLADIPAYNSAGETVLLATTDCDSLQTGNAASTFVLAYIGSKDEQIVRIKPTDAVRAHCEFLTRIVPTPALSSRVLVAKSRDHFERSKDAQDIWAPSVLGAFGEACHTGYVRSKATLGQTEKHSSLASLVILKQLPVEISLVGAPNMPLADLVPLQDAIWSVVRDNNN